MDASLLLRQLISLSPAKFGPVIALGAAIGGGLVAVVRWSGLPPVPDWSVISLGVALVFLPAWLVDGYRKTRRLQMYTDLEALDHAVQRGKLSDVDARRFYRQVAERLAENIGNEVARDPGREAARSPVPTSDTIESSVPRVETEERQ